MKTLVAIFGLLAIGATAQDKAPGIYVSSTPVMGKKVKGAPYSAVEITESSQILADGTHISRQTKTAVFRDSEGRVRRETPAEVTIFDPVAGFSYTLNPKAKTVVRTILGTLVMDHNRRFFFVRRTAPGAEEAAKARKDMDAAVSELKAGMAQLNQELADLGNANSPAIDRLGQQTIEGVTADGVRSTQTIEAGAIGNDRPIHVVNETWYSAELQTAVLTKHSDPRSGEEVFRLTNVQRSEPAAYLFAVPPDYKDVSNPEEPRKDE
jgi:hypothetical protein